MTSDVEEDHDLDEFQDACDINPIPDGMTFEKSIEEGQRAIDYFFNNQFDEAINLMTPWANSSLYHSVGQSVFMFLEAMLTFEQESVVKAVEALKRSIGVCNRYRRKNTIGESLGKIVKKPNYEHYSEVETHAELCYAECLLLRAMLTFMEDETLSSFIKAGFKIRTCYGSYKECQNILMNRDWPDPLTKGHFEGGVRMGIGTFNLMISLLPSKIIKLLEFIGFSGNKELGLEDLVKGYRLEGIRKILCVMTLLGYHLIVLHVLSHGEGDVEICDEILKKLLDKHPNGVWFLFFKGRLEFMKGNLDASLEWYTKSWKSQVKWPQFHHICFWELIWVHCLKKEWKEAAELSSQLLEGSRWSRTIYSYQKAAIMYMMDDLSVTDKMVIENLLKELPQYKQRIAGKSLPMEKFVIKKAHRFFHQKKTLILPVVELMYLWNLFKVLGKKFALAETTYKLIEKTELNFEASKGNEKYRADNKALILLLKGACLRHMGSPLQALECLETVISLQKEIYEDHYLIPYAIVELALIEWEQHNREKAILALEDAKKNYTGYSLESRLHFRIHTALTDFKAKMDQPYTTKL